MVISKKDIKDDVIKNFLENDNKGIAKIKVVKNSVVGYSGCGSCHAEAARFFPEDTIIIYEIKRSENSNSYFGKVRNCITSRGNYLNIKDVWISLSSSNIQFVEYQKPVEEYIEYKKLVGVSKT